MNQGPGFFSYDELQYVGTAYLHTCPDWLATVARLHGLRPAPADGCRVLEIACGDGANLLPMAYAQPGSTFLGIDLVAEPLAAAREAAARLQISNVRFEACDLAEFPAEEGQFDYIVAHGIYSWCPPKVRDRLMALCAAHLAPQGVAFVSFNAYPGYHYADLERAAMLFHLGNSEAASPTERARQALGMLDFIAKAEGEDDFHTQHLSKAREMYLERVRTGEAATAWFNHDLLSEHNTPFYFHQFVEHAGAHGLQFVSDSLPRILPLMALPEKTRDVLQGLLGKPLVLEQYLDFVFNSRFRQVLLCRADQAVDRSYGQASLDGLFVSGDLSPLPTDEGNTAGANAEDAEDFQGPLGKVTIQHAHARDAIRRVGAAGKGGVPFSELAANLPAGVAAEQLISLLLRLYLGKMVRLGTGRGIAADQAGERPKASALARWQAETNSTVINLFHEKVQVGPLTRQLLRLLDGHRERSDLRRDLEAWISSGQAASDRAMYGEADGLPTPTLGSFTTTLDDELATMAKLGLLLS